ncbi:AfsA-related hotdog domain-containing protein [Vibrio aestuarianus]|uniref:AfsA-related hotdog domain-containing protein n=1 Tax=Vibrio aestuarianus TaxID=28171 RepID=UPI00237D2B6F|nr:AfsA-related hotdog domain-containing protein [Vibrio aestuarianus]MDE1330418.1 hypothetical protein [Vibrio aestuarianus]
MDNISCTVIGSPFKAISNSKNIFSIDDVSNLKESLPKFNSLYIGQGLSYEENRSLVELVESLDCDLNIIDEATWLSKKTVHKHNINNVLISTLNKETENNFSFTVKISNNNELINDHITGLHIPAVVLTEAARQSLLSIIETYFEDKSLNMRFIINSTKNNFHNFVFPFNISGQVQFYFLDETKLKTSIRAKVTIFQFNEVCSEFEFEASLIPVKLADMTESIQLSKRII